MTHDPVISEVAGDTQPSADPATSYYLTHLTRRQRGLLGVGAFVGISAASRARAEGTTPVRGGNLVVAQFPEPPILTSALTVAGPTQLVSTKIGDGLLSYDFDLQPVPQLATGWTVSSDGLTISFTLRSGVRWHDGKPFTSEDVAYSVLEVWKKYHSRGRSTFANVIAVDTPDPLTAIWRLSAPAPYVLNALASGESTVVAKHLYAGTDVLANPHNDAPVGTGPFRFERWQKGEYISLVRNPDYWDHPKPYLDRVVFRVLPDDYARSTALETGEIDLVAESNVPASELGRLSTLPNVVAEKRGYATAANVNFFAFNLDRPVFQDVRVRRAFAHAIDNDFIARTIWNREADAATGPISPLLGAFYTKDVPLYPFDPAKALALLDEAGLIPDASGIRLSITHDYLPYGDYFVRTAEYLSQALRKVGIKLQVRSQDFAGFIRRVYTDRDFDTISAGGSTGPDPAIGVQRYFWSKNFERGVAFSNCTHYQNPDADRLLEAAQTEVEPAKRIALYREFQRVVQADLPQISLISINYRTFANRRVRDHTVSADGVRGNFADTFLSSN